MCVLVVPVDDDASDDEASTQTAAPSAPKPAGGKKAKGKKGAASKFDFPSDEEPSLDLAPAAGKPSIW